MGSRKKAYPGLFSAPHPAEGQVMVIPSQAWKQGSQLYLLSARATGTKCLQWDSIIQSSRGGKSQIHVLAGPHCGQAPAVA